jgi:hypothetical protein
MQRLKGMWISHRKRKMMTHTHTQTIADLLLVGYLENLINSLPIAGMAVILSI